MLMHINEITIFKDFGPWLIIYTEPEKLLIFAGWVEMDPVSRVNRPTESHRHVPKCDFG